MSRFDSTLRYAMIASLALALGVSLSACGRRGPLEPPPGAYNTPQDSAQVDAQGKPVAPQGQKRRLPIDWLLD